jgi:hypothetical protein
MNSCLDILDQNCLSASLPKVVLNCKSYKIDSQNKNQTSKTSQTTFDLCKLKFGKQVPYTL